jgi:hypothetical protein
MKARNPVPDNVVAFPHPEAGEAVGPLRPGGPAPPPPGVWRLPRAPGLHARAPHTPDRVRQERRNHMAFLSLVMGICAWVPLVIVFAAPLSLLFAVLALWQARRPQARHGVSGALWGVVLSGIAVLLHGSVALAASLIGWGGRLLGL